MSAIEFDQGRVLAAMSVSEFDQGHVELATAGVRTKVVVLRLIENHIKIKSISSFSRSILVIVRGSTSSGKLRLQISKVK